MDTIGNRIRAEREAQKVSRADLARAAGIAPTTLSDLELGLSKSTTQLHRIAQRLKVRVEWLETGKGAKGLSEPNADSEYADIIGYSQAAGLGAGAEALEYAETHSLKFKKTSLRRRGIYGRNLAVYYGKGDSMEPTIKDGDAILFDTSDTRVVDGLLYVIQVDGMARPEYFVKRAMVLDTGVYFQSDNPHGDHHWRKPKPMASKRHPITVIGRVHWIGGWAD
ncbi:S24 family peptidase [Stenotrophomonas sp. Marseille-Q5258]|uniref:XRE family transcriptional regulator n=1 Tax=Stenotrophomonas sp. Marseille-Q5258 TaxID=2972779 RepID=UPI0021C5879D|nr:S24 family peptidase [Stenotrophomonas sp. Marseille-Q5258]